VALIYAKLFASTFWSTRRPTFPLAAVHLFSTRPQARRRPPPCASRPGAHGSTVWAADVWNSVAGGGLDLTSEADFRGKSGGPSPTVET
jgi:hypothetical protein